MTKTMVAVWQHHRAYEYSAISLQHMKKGQVGALSHWWATLASYWTDYEPLFVFHVVAKGERRWCVWVKLTSLLSSDVFSKLLISRSCAFSWYLSFSSPFSQVILLQSITGLQRQWLAVSHSVQMRFICSHDSLLTAVFISHKAGWLNHTFSLN